MEPEKQTELESDEQGDASIQTFSSVSLEEAAVALKDLKLSNEADKSKQSMGGARPKENIGRRQPDEADKSKQIMGGARPKENIGRRQPDEADRSKQSMGGARPKEYTGKRKPGADVCKKYYGVSLPSAGLAQAGSLPLVYEDKFEAIHAIKRIPGARFKEFSTRSEALEYASVFYETLSRQCEKQVVRSFRSREIHELQEFIETGNEASFLELVWSNPRYLVNKFGKPTVIQAKMNYNALHIAAKCGQTGMFISILYMIQDHQFLSALYPDDSSEETQSRIEHLVDMFLNMPDKVMSETALHLACKFGHESIVSILLSYPQCRAEMKNKDGYSAKHLICQHHVCSSSDHKARMRAVFDDVLCVPLLQDDVHSFVGPLCDCNTVLMAATSSRFKENTVFCSFAGPGSYNRAVNLSTIFKTKEFPENSSGTVTFSEMCLSDPERGLQRAGRILCKDFSLGWLEYWSGLNCWLDICSPTGLERLNEHLKKQTELINLQGEVPSFIHLIENFMNEFVEKIPSLVVNSMHLFFFNELQSLAEHMECFTKHSYSNEAEICNIHEEIGHMLYLKLTNNNHSNLENFQSLKLFLLSRFSHPYCFQKPEWKMFSCILRFAFYFQSSSTDIISLFTKRPVCNCDFCQADESYVYSSKLCYYDIVSLRQELTNHLVQQYQTEPREEAEEPKQTVVVPLWDLPFNFLVSKNDGCFLSPVAVYPDPSEVRAFETMYLNLVEGFNSDCFNLMGKYEHALPFASLGYFFSVMSNALNNWKQICEVNYYEDCHLLHYEFANCLAFKMCTGPGKTLYKWKTYLEGKSLACQITDLAKHGMTLAREWMHLLCVLKQFCFVLDEKTALPVCTCVYNKDRSQQSVHPGNCLILVRRLRDLYTSAAHFIHAERLPRTRSDGSKQLNLPKSRDTVKEVLVPEVPDTAKEVFVGGESMSDDDIYIFLALSDARVFICRLQHPYIFRWKILMEAIHR